jgi:serine/threonine protein kinase
MVPVDESNTTTGASSDFLQAIRNSRILSEPQLEKLEANMAAGQYPSEPDELAARLVKDGVLTEYQARQIQKGKSETLNFGNYVILDFLGKGTMGKVYKARHRMMGRVVALKILDARYVASSTRSLDRFQREMQLVGRLDHPNVVRAFDADRVADCYFIAMEYAAGLTLEDLLKAKGALPPADVIYFASQAADGLAHAHARGVIHRDIKPSNLLLTEGKKLKILDFGLGTLLEPEDQSSALTSAGMAVGTPDYISPEQARVVKLDGRSDLYSLGCTIYHLLSGKLPFKGESSMDCIVGRITGKPVPITEVKPGLPPRLIQTIEKLMATSPDDRYQTAEEAATALRSLLRPKNAPASTSGPAAAVIAAAPGPTSKEATTAPGPGPKRNVASEAPRPSVQAAIRTAKPKQDSLRSWGIGRWSKAQKALAAGTVAAVGLIVAAIVVFRSSSDELPAPQQETSQTSNGPIPPTAAADARPPSPPTASPKQAATAPTQENRTRPVPPAAAADGRQPSLAIETPKAGATVGTRENLTGRIESDGWPVIFVQADIPGQPWWCQAPVTKVDGGMFSTEVVFGDELTPSGTKFRVAGIVARTREEALKFNAGSKHQALPEGVPQSGAVVVTHR